ncbi:MAG TPA: DUF89 family protein [Spirochaetia bacterium]|nr:DUF89 family protein [Spirochaetia bacterium]
MRTYIDCLPCFFSQAIAACRLLGVSDADTKRVVDRVGALLPKVALESSPPETAALVHRVIREALENPDPYAKIKRKSNEAALAVYPQLREKVRASADPLRAAVEISIAGNIIDYGALLNPDLGAEISRIVEAEERAVLREDARLFDFLKLQNAIDRARSVLYLADNAGEIVFDRILIEEMRARRPAMELTVAVRGGPVLNDATEVDAREAGIDRIAVVISNGTDVPGTVLRACSPEFRDVWKQSDLIISKGQGNYESVAGEPGNIFFLLMVKCEVLARDIGAGLRDVILTANGAY